jgi:putative CocE/NonD family hydrolase
MDYHYMVADQRHASRRPDVLVYQTPVLTEDTTVSGPIKVDLWVKSTGTDADFVVKVIDVFPGDYPDLDPNPTGVRMGNYQMLIRGEPFRAKFRNSFSKPEPLEPGTPTKISFTMPDICHTFRPGHRIMVQVQSSWFPLVDRNPQKFCDIYSATDADFTKETQTILRAPGQASAVTLWVR